MKDINNPAKDITQLIIDGIEEHHRPLYFQDELRRLGASPELVTFVQTNFFPRLAITETLDRIEVIQKAVSDFYGLRFDDEVKLINLRTRKREVVEARQVSMTLSRLYTRGGLAIIGKLHGDHDHATILHAIGVVRNLNETDRDFRKDYQAMKEQMKALFGDEIKRVDDGKW
jgi:hypothetical protein